MKNRSQIYKRIIYIKKERKGEEKREEKKYDQKRISMIL